MAKKKQSEQNKERKKAAKAEKSEKAREGSGGLLSAWYVRVALVVLVATPFALAYWYRADIAAAYLSARRAVLSVLGLGIAPVAAWGAAFLVALARQRAWFSRPTLWVGSLALLALTLGMLSFFQPARGTLGAFTLNGQVSLGGRVGEALGGSPAWLGALKLLGIFVAGMWVVAPALTADIGVALGRLLLALYAYLALGVKWLLSALAYLYRYRPWVHLPQHKAQAAPVLEEEDEEEPRMPPEVLSPYTRSRAVAAPATPAISSSGFVVASPVPEAPSTPYVSRYATPAQPAAVGTSAEVGPDDDDDIADEDEDLAEQPASYAELADSAEASGQEGDDELEGEGEEAEDEEEEEAAPPAAALPPADAAPVETWEKPSTSLLIEGEEGGITEEEIRETAETIKRTLSEYSVEVEVTQVRPGPAVTMYGLVPGWVRRYKQVREKDEYGRPRLDKHGKPIVAQVETKTRVKVDSILSREKDLALALKTPTIRIETPAMGQSLIGIEVPNPRPSLVTLRSVMESAEFSRLRHKAQLPVALGKGSGGETVVIDLARMPHLLIAGATGSGKSVCINTIVSCLVMEKTPAEMRLLLVDPKRVELTPYNGIPHLLAPVVVENDQVVGYLKGLIREMMDRYRLMEEVGVRNIQAYNKKMPQKMPFLVVAVDELADLMMTAAFDVEQSLCRLAQLGRATGIHLIVATQRPSVDVITGLIKANFPSRISFGVISQVDSRTILDTAGAEKLLGRGDMLYLPVDAPRPIRVQGVFISDQEIENLVSYWKTTRWLPLPEINLEPVLEERSSGEDDEDDEDRDQLLEKAIEMARQYNKISTSLLQRRLRIGYPRAARLMDQLEDAGVVGPSDGSKSRDVIISNRM